MCANIPMALWVSTFYVVFMATNALEPKCNLRHLCCHCTRCWLSRRTKIITCVSFNHFELLLSTNQHCAYQRLHSHSNQHCHCRPNTSGFTFLILHNPRVCCLRCNSSQGKELSQLTPPYQFLPLATKVLGYTNILMCFYMIVPMPFGA